MNRLFEHVGKVIDTDTYIGAMDKVEQGIKMLTNQATANICSLSPSARVISGKSIDKSNKQGKAYIITIIQQYL